MEITPPTYPDVLRRAETLIVCHLSVNDPLTFADVTLGAFLEASFNGYLPKLADSWSPVRLGSSPISVSRTMRAIWGAKGDPSDQLIRGWFLTAELSPGVDGLVAYGSVKPAVNMKDAGRSCAILAHVSTLPGEDATGLRLLMTSTALAFFGGLDQMEMRGTDRIAILELRDALTRISRRDAEIPTLSARSRRSRIPVVPNDIVELVSSATLLVARCNTLLGL